MLIFMMTHTDYQSWRCHSSRIPCLPHGLQCTSPHRRWPDIAGMAQGRLRKTQRPLAGRPHHLRPAHAALAPSPAAAAPQEQQCRAGSALPGCGRGEPTSPLCRLVTRRARQPPQPQQCSCKHHATSSKVGHSGPRVHTTRVLPTLLLQCVLPWLYDQMQWMACCVSYGCSGHLRSSMTCTVTAHTINARIGHICCH
jgi:hypothetical protein